LKARGLRIAPELAVADGALGFWKALDAVFPGTRHQRCWLHKVGNILNKVAKSIQSTVKQVDFGTTHLVEIVRYRDLSRHEAELPGLPHYRRVQRNDLYQRLAGLGDHERFPLGRLIDQARQIGLGFMYDWSWLHVY